nr:uncharacterized protein LOC129280630 [Lytechinus pictus]
MTTTKMMLTSFCLFYMICACIAQRWLGPRPKPYDRLTEACPMYASVKLRENIVRCNWNCLDKLAAMDEEVNMYPRHFMKRLYKLGTDGHLCYAHDGQAVEIAHPCEALDLACSKGNPQRVDFCWSK